MASKKSHRSDEELYRELCFGLLIGASPTLGFCQPADGERRLLSARLPETSLHHVRRRSFGQDWRSARLKFVCDEVLAVLSMHIVGLVHCDMKPDNLMVDWGSTVHLIDDGCTSRPGDPGALDHTGSVSWHVFSFLTWTLQASDIRP